MRNLFAGIALGVCLSSAFATGEDLQNCLYKNGMRMDHRVCDSLRKRDARDAVQNARQQQLRAEDQARYAQRQEDEALRKAAAAEKAAEDKRRWDEERAVKQAATDKYLADQRREEERQEASARQVEATRKKVCGADYSNPQIGMSIERAKSCVAPLKLIGQVNRADGVVSTYRHGGLYMHVMDGKVVSWNGR